MSTYFDPDGGVKFVISLRSERPIEGCELVPHPFLYIKGGAMDNATRAKMMEANPHHFTYSWRRGPKRAMCENQDCSRREAYEPSSWSRISIDGPPLQCAICEKLGNSRHESTFCCKGCLKSYWRKHSLLRHENLSKLTEKNKKGNMSIKLDDTLLLPDDDKLLNDEYIINTGGIPSDESSLKDWIPICNEKTYIPKRDDVGRVLRIEVKAIASADGQVLAGPIVVITEPVLFAPRPPPKRPLIPIAGSTSGGGGARFRVVSYNVLAELYATKQAYPYCNTWNLSWPYRKNIIMQELDDVQGDVICLQEVQADHYEQHLLSFLQGKGYDGIFKQKTRESMGQYGKVDGCATFWRRSKFMMVENYSVEFNECARHAASDLGLDESDGRKYINRLFKDNVAQIVVLEVISRTTVRLPRQSIQLCVANTHLYSNHTRPDIKLWQAYALMRELENFVIRRDIALIICGDLNSEPQSAVYEFMMEGNINIHRPELDPNDSIRILPDLSQIIHTLELSSAMSSALGDEPSFTNYTGKFKGTLDYICYTPSRLRVMAVSGFPDATDLEIENGIGLPSASYASDHLMLFCDMSLSITGNGNITRQQTHSSNSAVNNNNNSMMNNRKGGQHMMPTSPTKTIKNNMNGRSPALSR